MRKIKSRKWSPEVAEIGRATQCRYGYRVVLLIAGQPVRRFTVRTLEEATAHLQAWAAERGVRAY